MVLAAQDDHRSMLARSGEVCMLEDVTRTVQARTLPVPVPHYPIHLRMRMLIEHLGAAQHRDGELLVLRRLVRDSLSFERSARLAHGNVDASERPAGVDSDKGFG